MTNQEKELFSAVPCNEFNTYWIPCTWFVYRIQEASKKGKLLNEYALETIMRVWQNMTIGQKIQIFGKSWKFSLSNHKLKVRHDLLAPKIFCFNSYGKSFAFHWCFSGVLWVPSQVWSFVVLWLGFNPYGLHSSGDLSNLPVFHLYSHWSSKARREQGLLTSHTFESTIFW